MFDAAGGDAGVAAHALRQVDDHSPSHGRTPVIGDWALSSGPRSIGPGPVPDGPGGPALAGPPVPLRSLGLRLQSDVSEVDVLRGVDRVEGLGVEAVGRDAQRVRAGLEVVEPEVAEAVGRDGERLAAGAGVSVQVAPMTTSFSTGSYTVPAMNFFGMFR